jgi:DNA-binding transcriptional regulator YhcF (GntR family)
MRIDPESSVSPSEQVRRQVVEGVREGRFAAGTPLPTVRALAADLGIAANTAARAYKLLELDGIIETFGRRGTFVAAQGDPVVRALHSAAAEYARVAASLGVDHDTALSSVVSAVGSRL